MQFPTLGQSPARRSSRTTSTRGFPIHGLPARVAQAAVLGGLVAGAVAFTSLDHTVTVSVDGTSQQVHTYAGTVGGALDRAGITVGPHDVLAPAASTALADSTRIVLERGRPVQLRVDGAPRTVWVTARSVGQLLGDLHLRTDGAALSADRSTRIPLSGLALSVRLPKAVTITVDGASSAVTTTASTLAGALDEAGVTLGAQDQVSPDPSTVPSEGLAVTVVRVATGQVVQDVAISHGVSRIADSNLYTGTENVVRPGADGLRRRTFDLTLHDGQEVARTLATSIVVQPPVTEVVAYGTMAHPAPAPAPAPALAPKPAPVARPAAPQPAAAAPQRSTSGVDGLNWAALARCESGGNPQAYNSHGYYGLYQFSIGTWHGVGGSGTPSDYPAAEQTYRAKLLYQSSGASPWPVCGKNLFR